jgi:hypothetical protein
METMELEIGGVYRQKVVDNDGRKSTLIVRIICSNQYEVLMDVHMNEKGWLFSDVSKQADFYRISKNASASVLEFMSSMPLSNIDIKKFRSDLPIYFARIKELCWNTKLLLQQNEIMAFLQEHHQELAAQNIATASIMLSVQNEYGVPQPCQRLDADNGSHFTVDELIYKANKLRCKANLTISNGIGFFRLGVVNSLPAYYSGNYGDMAGYYTK